MRTRLTIILLFCYLFFLRAENPQKIEIDFGSHTRQYLLYIPDSYNPSKKSGLIVCLHGFNRTMEDFFGTYPIKPVADQLNLLVLAPQALPEQDPEVINKAKDLASKGIDIPLEAAWGCGLKVKATVALEAITLLNEELNKNVDDVGFIKQIVNTTSSQYSIDADNFFIFGTSMGGFMSYQYSMTYGKDLAGLISVCGSMGTAIKSAAENISVPICDFHSKTDEVVPYGGTLSYGSGIFEVKVSLCQPKSDVISFWVNKNRANTIPQEENVAYYPSTNNISVKKIRYDALASAISSEVIHYQIDGASHSYYMNKGNGDCMDYNEEVIKFIRSHYKDSPTGIESVIAQKLVVSPNPVQNRCTVYGTRCTEGDIRIFDMTGRLKGIYQANEEQTEIDFSGYYRGIYLLKYNGKTYKVIKK